MSFHLKRFVRIVPATALRNYFQVKQPDVADRIKWASLKDANPEPILNAIQSLSPRAQEAVNIDFENVEQLCDEIGQRALHSVAAADQELLAALRLSDSNEARGILLLLANEALFDRALTTAYDDRRRHGRSWGAFSIGAAPRRRRRPLPNWSAFEADIAKILLRADGSVGKLKIDFFERGVLNEAGTPVGSIEHLSIHREGLPIMDLAFRGDELKRQARRPVDAAAIFFDRSEMTLDVIAGGGRTIRRNIAESFTQNFVVPKGTVRPIDTRRFALNRLKQPFKFLTDPTDGIKSVKVTHLCLEHMSARFERLTLEVDPSDLDAICTRSAQWFGDNDPLQQAEWSVRSAVLRVVFYPAPGSKRSKIVPIELRREGSSVREQTHPASTNLSEAVSKPPWGT
jgi:hypothetical protein